MDGSTDLTDRVAARMEREVQAGLDDPMTLEESPFSEDGPNLTDKIRFKWRREDQVALSRIENLAKDELDHIFLDIFSVIDAFYAKLRVPEQNEYGVVRLDIHGRQVWKRDPDTGNFIEDWSQLTGQDIEESLLRLQGMKLIVSPRVNRLNLEAIYARDVARDIIDDAWGHIVDGTVDDKKSKTNRVSRPDRYHAYFRYYLHSSAKTLLDEISNLINILERIGYWRTKAQG